MILLFNKKPVLKEGIHIFGTRQDGDFKNIFFGIVSGVQDKKIGINGITVNPVGLKNKVKQGKAGPRSIEILENPTPDNCILALVYRAEHENFTDVIDLDKERILIIPPRVYSVLDGWIRESIPEIINSVLSLPAGTERDQAKRVLRQRMDTLTDKNLKRTLYSVSRSLKILN